MIVTLLASLVLALVLLEMANAFVGRSVTRQCLGASTRDLHTTPAAETPRPREPELRFVAMRSREPGSAAYNRAIDAMKSSLSSDKPDPFVRALPTRST